MITDDGSAIGIHQLRWLLGTIGLTGSETVLIYTDHEERGRIVGAMLHLAGQETVHVVVADTPEGSAGGTPRSFSREAVYTAPARTEQVRVSSEQSGPLFEQLLAYSLSGGTVIIGSGTTRGKED